MSWNSPISRKLYLRIWLAVAGSVLVLSLLVGWAWHAAEARREQERERLGPPPPREVVVRNAQGEVLGNAEAQVRRAPDRGLEFEVTMRDGEVLYLQMPPRNRGLEGGRRCLVAHPINPPYLIPAAEVVPAPWTAPEVVERVRDFGTRMALGATPGGVFTHVLAEALVVTVNGIAAGMRSTG